MCTPRYLTELTFCRDDSPKCKLVHVRKPLATQVTTFFIIVTITKFSILIGSARAYLSHNNTAPVNTRI